MTLGNLLLSRIHDGTRMEAEEKLYMVAVFRAYCVFKRNQVLKRNKYRKTNSLILSSI